MLRSGKDLFGSRIVATDGEIGKVHDFLFDDVMWGIRYMVADTGNWLSGRLVLVSPACLARPSGDAQSFPVSLTREQVEDSPSIEADAPVSRQHEIELAKHYEWPVYWGGGIFTASALAGFPRPVVESSLNPVANEIEEASARAKETGDPHLFGMRSVDGHKIQASDGEIGHVSDFIVDDADWSVRYLEIDTRNWLPGKHVLVAPQWIEDVNWGEQSVHVGVTKDKVKDAPEYEHGHTVTRQYEEALHEYYGRPAYWQVQGPAKRS